MKNIDGAEEIIIDTLKQTISNEKYISTLFLFEIIFYNNYEMPREIIEGLLKKDMNSNEIIRAILLEKTCKEKDSEYADIIKSVLMNLFNKENKIDFKTEDWLVKYILYYYDWIRDDEIIQDIYYEYFKIWKENKLKFVNL